jgi:hypothetical protein
MPVAPITHFDTLAEDLPHGLHAWNTNPLKLVLTNTEPVAASDTVLADIVQITTAGGYPTGGYDVDLVNSGQSAGIYALIVYDFTITATGAAMDGWRFATLYNSVNNRLICYWTYNPTVPIIINVGESYDFEFDPSEGILPIYFVV